jgi:hypothetical protein
MCDGSCKCYPSCPDCPSEVVCHDRLVAAMGDPPVGGGHPEYLALLDEIGALHRLKSGGYGTGADPFANFTAVANMTGQPRYLYPVHRSIEKLTRVLSLHEQDRKTELEEEFLDVASLLLCAAAMLREDN